MHKQKKNKNFYIRNNNCHCFSRELTKSYKIKKKQKKKTAGTYSINFLESNPPKLITCFFIYCLKFKFSN